MMARPHAVAGSTPESSLKQGKIGPTNGMAKAILATDGDSHGLTTAASFITGHRRVQTENPGASGRSWYGGTRKSKSGPDWIHQTSKKQLRPMRRKIWNTDREWMLWVGLDRLFCTLMDWAGSMFQAD